MELYLFLAAALLIPMAGQLALLRLGRARPRLRFTRWLLLIVPAVFLLLAVQAGGEDGLFSGLVVLFHLAAALAALTGCGLGWLGDWVWRKRG